MLDQKPEKSLTMPDTSNTTEDMKGSLQNSCKLYPPVAAGWRRVQGNLGMKLNQAINIALAPMCGVREDLTKYMRGDSTSNTSEENETDNEQ